MISSLFISFIYQPFLNVLVGFYWILGRFTVGKPDMGIAVILLTILIRVLLLPITLSSSRSEKERREISRKVKNIDETFAADPIRKESERKKVIRKSSKVMVGEILTLIIQVTIALMLWKMFKTGLPGEDINLIYSFMPKFDLPFNLVFLGKYDLSITSFFLNLIQSTLIFILESITLFTSPYKVSKNEVVRLQLVLPLVSFIIFIGLPAGKKLFVITTLIFSIILKTLKTVKRKLESYKRKKAQAEEVAEVGESQSQEIIVQTIE